jgi:hypothetical protein
VRRAAQRLLLAQNAGLPDGTFSNQKSQFVYIYEGLCVENVGKFYGHLVYFMAIWYVVEFLWYV